MTNYKIICIIESKVERWFEEADINTCIIILEKCAGETNKKARDDNLVRFGYLFKPLRHFIPPAQDMWEKQLDRLRAIDNLIKTILAHDNFYQNEELRTFPKRQSDLWEEGFDKKTGKYVGAKWGKYLRAPEIFFKILEKGKDKLIPLKSVAEVRFGIKTGANEFFYLTEEEIKQKGIEKEFWMHRDVNGNWVPNSILKSFKESPTVKIESSNLKYRILLVDKDKKKLRGTHVHVYIRQGESRKFGDKIPSKTVSCRSRGEQWFDLGNHIPTHIFYPRRIGDRFMIPYAQKAVFSSDNLFPVYPTISKDFVVSLAACMNSSVLNLFNELSGRRLTGAINVVDMDVWMAEKIPVINPCFLSKDVLSKLVLAFNVLMIRPIEHTLIELGADTPEEVSLDKVKPDRRELDRIVMGDILGLAEEEQLEVYRAVVDLVKSRIEKAKSLGKRKKTREGIDIDLLVKSVMEKVGEETLGRFYKENVLTHKSLTTKELPRLSNGAKIEKDLFGWRINYGKKYLKCASEAEAKYLKVFMEAGLDSVKIPKDEKYLKRILPELLSLKQRIDKVVEDYIGSIVDIKTKEKIEHQLWAEIARPDLT